METYDVTFPEGVRALGGARRCRICRLTPESTVALLRSLESDLPPLLLGCARRACPGVVVEISADERAALGVDPEGSEETRAFFRLVIPDGDPLSAGFDTSRLVLTAPTRGTALETSRPGMGLVPLRALNDAGPSEA